ncbi:hypothetical protein BN970_03309 [Mycolicibacterium conceptionense]|uniref:Uncharacterized protein n=1 Tax=Mycolicibacterium conceptionense TaxID=451644 RepID=A0A0U1DJ59_9MYCO|nr:hypothetical protein BN970_03309 [Mycolicibacterium conceptionense]
MKIRSDLEGVVYVHTAGGGVACLKAGDTVPDGVEVGDHLTEKTTESKESDGAGDKPRRGRPPRSAPVD